MRKISLLIPVLALSAALPLVAQTHVKSTSSAAASAPSVIATSVAATGIAGPRGAVGPRGADGAPGVALPHIIIVAATADPVANGSALLNALAVFASTPATAAQPYVVQLDAGVFTLSSTAALPPYVSLTGAGMLSTVINGNLSLDNSTSITSKQSIERLGILAPSGAPLTVQLGKFLVIDQVQLSGGTSSLTATSGNAHFLITNSILGSFSVAASLANGSVQAASVSTIIGTQLDPVSVAMPAPAVLNCLSDYTSAGTLLSNGCQ